MFQEAVAAHVQGNMDAARALYQGVLELAPAHAPSLNNLGAICLQLGDRVSAIRYFKEALRLDPVNADAWNNLGVLLAKSGDAAGAVGCYEKALNLKLDSETCTNLGAAYKDLGRLDQAEIMHRKALELDPANAKAYNNLALVHKEAGRLDLAVSCFKEALRLKPEDEEIFFNLGESLVEVGALAEAVALSEKALCSFRDSITTIVGAARVFLECGEWEKADPLIRAAACHPFSVADLGVLRHLLLYLNASACAPKEIANMHFLSGQLIREQLKEEIEANPFNFNGRFERLPRLRIGYVSPDFNRHSVGWFFREIVTCHDRQNFDIYCYSLSGREDDLTRDIEAKATVFRRVKTLGDRQIARQIFDDRIQVLVDLAGYTRGNRLDVFAFRPAPVQITAIGYPHGTGLSTMDYRITDHLAEGPDAEAEYREKLIRLPGFFLPFSQFELPEERLVKEELGLPGDTVTIVSFNAWHKLRPEVLRLWNQILHHASDACMVFSFRHSNTDFAQRSVRAYFDVAPDRLFFLPQTATEEQHRARYQIADLALDPFPYCGTTTSWEALSMGVPVVTVKGKRHVQRTTWSLLANLGLSCLSASDAQTYVKIAVDLAQNPDRLAEVRQRIRGSVQKATKTGNKRYVRTLEACFLRIWNAYLERSRGWR